MNIHAGFLKQSLLNILLLLLLSGCGYHFTGNSPGRLAAGQSLNVAFIVNETVSPTAETVIRRAIYQQGNVMRGLYPVKNNQTADIRISGKLVSYTSKVVAYSAVDKANEYRLIIAVDLQVDKKGDTKPLWKGQLQAYQDYPASTNLAIQRNSEEAALEAASQIIAQKLLSYVEQSY